MVILRRRPGRFNGTLPDGLAELAEHNLITFKSHHEALDDWALRELTAHYVAYRKLVSRRPSALLPAECFRLYAVVARFPQRLAAQLPWHERQAGVYDCQWGLDMVRIIVAGQLPREAHNAPLHLFSASPGLIEFADAAYQQRSAETSALLQQLFKRFREKELRMVYTMKDFRRDFLREYLGELTPEDRRDTCLSLPVKLREELLRSLPAKEREEFLRSLSVKEREELLRSLPTKEREELLRSLPLEERLAGLSAEEIQQYLERQSGARPAASRKPRRKK